MKIVLAEDSALLRESLAEVLRSAGHSVHTVCDAEELVQCVQQSESPPQLLITDVRMPPRGEDDGLQAAYQLRQESRRLGHDPLPVVVLSQYVAAAYLDSLMEHGAFGYLLKDRVANVQEFLQTLETVFGGGTVVDPEVVRTLLQQRASGIDALTAREREVLGLMAQGLSNAAIAQQLVLSAGAVSKHVAAVFLKLGFMPQDENRRVRAVLTWLRRSPL